MASIKDAFDNAIADKMAFVKYFIYSIPVYFSYEFFSKGNTDWFLYLSALTLLMLLTILVICIKNTRNGKNELLPDFNIISFIKTALKTLTALGPITAVCIILGHYLVKIQIPIPVDNIQLIYSIIVWLILSSIILTSLMIFAKNESIKEAYNLVLISNCCIDVLIAVIFFIPRLVLINLVFVGVIAYIFGIFWNFSNPIFIFICSLALVINVAITGDYLAQLDYENITH